MSQKSRLMHECPNCGWVGKAPEHAFTPAGYKRCPKCKEIGIDIGTHMLPIETFAWPPSPAPLAWSSERMEELARRVLWPVRWRIEGDENADYIIKSVVEILREELNPPQAGPSPDPMEAR